MAFKATQGDAIGWFTPDYKLQRPTFNRLRRILGPAVTLHASRTENIIELAGGGLMEFWTLDNPDAGRSRAYDHIVIDEASLKKEGLREIIEQAITPTLLDRGGTLTLAGTPKGVDPDNFFYIAATQPEYGYRVFHAPSWLNPNLSQEEVSKLEENNPPLVYQQEYCAEFVDWGGAAFFSLDKLLTNGLPVEPPTIVDAIVATIDTATKTGKENDGTGVVWSAYSRWPTPSLVILDWDLVQIEGAILEMWLPSVIGRASNSRRPVPRSAGLRRLDRGCRFRLDPAPASPQEADAGASDRPQENQDGQGGAGDRRVQAMSGRIRSSSAHGAQPGGQLQRRPRQPFQETNHWLPGRAEGRGRERPFGRVHL